VKKTIFKGSGVAIVTPFINEHEVNFEELGKLVEFQIQEGTDSIIVCGTTGESSTMTQDEKKATIKYVVDKVNKRVPVIAGTGGNCTQSAVEMSKYAQDVGADGVLVVTPYYNKTTQEGLIKHYETIANSINIPVILYNVPSRTGLNITPETAYKLSKIDNIVAIKEASGNISQVAEIANLCGDELAIYSGNDDQIVPIMSLGGIGVISVLANVMPKETHEMTKAYLDGDICKAKEIQLKVLPLVKALFCEVNPIPVKEALNIMGYNAGIPRLPLVQMSVKGKEKLETELRNIKLV